MQATFFTTFLLSITFLGLNSIQAQDSGTTEASDGFVALISGDTFDGFTQRGGRADYRVEDGVVTGTCVAGEPNSFMCTNKTYANFVLELEFKVDPVMNSGVQIRSECFEEKKSLTLDGGKTITIPANRVHGYQVEIDPSDRSWSGGIYDEARRGWINDLSENEDARNAFIKEGWNKYRIQCDGDHIQTWLNDVLAADLHDDLTSEGFIAFQVHGAYNKKEMIGSTVQWRNIRIKELPDSVEK